VISRDMSETDIHLSLTMSQLTVFRISLRYVIGWS
jgi:hypothetical protein